MRTSDGNILPPLPSGFDDLPLVMPPSEPLIDHRQHTTISPLQSRRREQMNLATSIEPSPTWQEKHQDKFIDDILRYHRMKFVSID